MHFHINFKFIKYEIAYIKIVKHNYYNLGVVYKDDMSTRPQGLVAKIKLRQKLISACLRRGLRLKLIFFSENYLGRR